MAGRNQLSQAKGAVQPGLTELLAEQRSHAQAADTATPEQLAAWYTAQLAATREKRDRRTTAQAKNAALLKSPADPRWARWWLDEVAFRYWDETVALLEKREHLLACPSHGVLGVDLSSLLEDPEGLSLRGIITGEGSTQWMRYCHECMRDVFRAEGERLYADFVMANKREEMK